MTGNEIMDFKFGKSIQIAMLIAFAFSSAARAQTACEAHVAETINAAPSDSDLKVAAAGAVISFTDTPRSSLDIDVKVYGKEDIRAMYKRWGCTEMLFISAKTGEIVKRIDLRSADSKVLTSCEEHAAALQAVASKDDKDSANRKVTAAGTVVSFTATPGLHLDSDVRVYGDKEENRAYVKSWGCTEMLFISAETGEIVKRIDLESASSRVAANEKESSKPADSPVEQLEDPTVENLNKLLDLDIGFNRRELAVLQKLQTWYEVDPDHPDAVALRKELCANLNTDLSERYLAVRGIQPKDDARNQKANEAINKLGQDARAEFDEKQDRHTDLIKKTTSAMRELTGMGFSCGQ